jgi:hypothetical protein
MTFKIENIKTDTANSNQEILGNYSFKSIRGLSEDRTYYCPCNTHGGCKCNYYNYDR